MLFAMVVPPHFSLRAQSDSIDWFSIASGGWFFSAFTD
jgi:hypothetical protein